MRKIKHLDDQGRPVTDVELERGLFDREVDDETVARLRGDALSLAEGKDAPAIRGYDVKGRLPYSGASAPGGTPLKQRSRLDFMRALSEEIKRRRRIEPEEE